MPPPANDDEDSLPRLVGVAATAPRRGGLQPGAVCPEVSSHVHLGLKASGVQAEEIAWKFLQRLHPVKGSALKMDRFW